MFCGRSLGHEYVPVEMPCPQGAICLSNWFRWKLQVDKVLSGPALAPQIVALTVQHSNYASDYEDQLRLFTVVPIEDAGKRKLLGADFSLAKPARDGKGGAALCD